MSPSIDRKKLEMLASIQVDGEPSIVAAVIDSLLQSAPAKVGNIECWANDGELVKIQKEAHSLKSSVQVIGATRLGELFLNLEKCSSIEAAKSLMPEVSQEFIQFLSEIKEIRSKL